MPHPSFLARASNGHCGGNTPAAHLDSPYIEIDCAAELARNPQTLATIPLGSHLTALTTSSRNII